MSLIKLSALWLYIIQLICICIGRTISIDSGPNFSNSTPPPFFGQLSNQIIANLPLVVMEVLGYQSAAGEMCQQHFDRQFLCFSFSLQSLEATPALPYSPSPILPLSLSLSLSCLASGNFYVASLLFSHFPFIYFILFFLPHPPSCPLAGRRKQEISLAGRSFVLGWLLINDNASSRNLFTLHFVWAGWVAGWLGNWEGGIVAASTSSLTFFVFSWPATTTSIWKLLH